MPGERDLNNNKTPVSHTASCVVNYFLHSNSLVLINRLCLDRGQGEPVEQLQIWGLVWDCSCGYLPEIWSLKTKLDVSFSVLCP